MQLSENPQMNIRKKHIRGLIRDLLAEASCISAPVDVEHIAHLRNALVHRQVVEDNVSGFLFRDVRTGSSVIGVNSGHASTRQRFTIAHELGHLLLHPADAAVHVDQHFQILRRDARSSEGTDLKEMESNFFAAELLMPEEFLIQDVDRVNLFDILDEESVKELARIYKVSPHAMTIRLTSLGLL